MLLLTVTARLECNYFACRAAMPDRYCKASFRLFHADLANVICGPQGTVADYGRRYLAGAARRNRHLCVWSLRRLSARPTLDRRPHPASVAPRIRNVRNAGLSHRPNHDRERLGSKNAP